jgi:hypothetical protein
LDNETFEKCSILFKIKSKIPDFERGKARILTAGIPVVFRELEFESDAACPTIAFGDGGRLGKRGVFFKALTMTKTT